MQQASLSASPRLLELHGESRTARVPSHLVRTGTSKMKARLGPECRYSTRTHAWLWGVFGRSTRGCQLEDSVRHVRAIELSSSDVEEGWLQGSARPAGAHCSWPRLLHRKPAGPARAMGSSVSVRAQPLQTTRVHDTSIWPTPPSTSGPSDPQLRLPYSYCMQPSHF